MKVKVKSLSHVRLFGTHGLQPTRLLHPWDFPGKNTGVGCHFLLQEIFPTQGLNPSLPHCRLTLYLLSHQGSPEFLNYWWYSQIYSFYAFEFVFLSKPSHSKVIFFLILLYLLTIFSMFCYRVFLLFLVEFIVSHAFQYQYLLNLVSTLTTHLILLWARSLGISVLLG